MSSDGERIAFFEAVIRDWLAEDDLTIIAGDWRAGAVMELRPQGRATLSAPRYAGDFAGLRELRIEGSGHHMHIDLARISHVEYCVAPSVCFGGKPAFEVRLLAAGRASFAFAIGRPYVNGRLDEAAVRRYFARLAAHGGDANTLLQARLERGEPCELWERVADCAASALAALPALARAFDAPADAPLSGIARIVDAALALRCASLVIYRPRTLIELKTELLQPRLVRFVEQGLASWQIGPYSGHHCHLDIDAVERVHFSAEPVSCQGGRLNYTIWFETAFDAGNPYRRHGYFSVTLNEPYAGDGSPRHDVIDPVFQLYRRFEDEACVSAEAAFAEQALARR